MRSIMNLIISTIFVGIPEFAFVSVLAIRFLKSLESITVNKFKMGLLIVLPALLTNLPDILGLSNLTAIVFSSFVISVVSMFVLTYIITKPTNKAIDLKWFSKVVLWVLTSFAIFVATELMLGYPIQVAANITTEAIANNAWIAVLGSSPERLIQFALLYVFSINAFKKIFTHDAHNLDILAIINSSKKHRFIGIGIIAMTVIYLTVFVVLFAVERILADIPTMWAILVSMLFMCAPFVSLFIFVESIYRSHSNREQYNKYIFGNARSKAIKAYEKASDKGDKETMESVKEVISALDLDE
jgi:hypothetical protein